MYICSICTEKRIALTTLCKIFDINRTSLYNFINKKYCKNDKKNTKIMEFLIEKRKITKYNAYGYRRMTQFINESNILNESINKKRIQRIMQENGLQSIFRKRKYIRAPKSLEAITAENIINRDFTTTGVNQKLFTDITQINTNLGPVFMSAIIDVYDKYVQGVAISTNQKTELVLKSLEIVKKIAKRDRKKMIIHTDRGSQYTSSTYTEALKRAGIAHSMSRPGKCPDNAPIETFWGIMKDEIFNNLNLHFNSFDEVEKYIINYIKFYNTERISKNRVLLNERKTKKG